MRLSPRFSPFGCSYALSLSLCIDDYGNVVYLDLEAYEQAELFIASGKE